MVIERTIENSENPRLFDMRKLLDLKENKGGMIKNTMLKLVYNGCGRKDISAS